VALTRERICREALAIVDDEGLDALSMRRLGARLGVEAMSLYRHVRDKGELLDALQAAVLGPLVSPRGRPRPWRAELGGQARALRSSLLRHPNVAPLLTRLPVRAPESAATVARARQSLIVAGLKPRAAEDAIHFVGMFTIGHVLFEITGGHARHLDALFRSGLEALLDGIERRNRLRRSRRR
jgi:AcrR family transcriptional regulator